MSNDQTSRSPWVGWFAGPKAENGDWFAQTVLRIVQDYHSWRRNYFPEDGVLLDSSDRAPREAFRDAFDDRLIELLGRLKNDFPFYSPRYAAHMVAEQTLPSIAAYIAAMLYNPNNVSTDAAPVTARLELEAAGMIARMLGYTTEAWAHLTSGGTVANIEALWVARSVRYLPLVVRDAREALALPPDPDDRPDTEPLWRSPSASLASLRRLQDHARAALGQGWARRVADAIRESPHNVAERGMGEVTRRLDSDPVLLAPETHHYCLEKALDVLGLGRRALVTIRVSASLRMDPADLDARLREVAAQGRHVLGVVAVVGTTEEGAVDPIDQVLDVRSALERESGRSFWLHADGAYGGYLRTVVVPERIGLGEPTARVRVGHVERDIAICLPERGVCGALERLGECDSIAIDPHKLGYIPYPAGAVCFRSPLVKALARQSAPYLDAPASGADDAGGDAIGVYVLEGSKPGAAAAAVWLSHSLIPLDTSGHGRLVRETIRSAAELHSLLVDLPAFAPGRAVHAVPTGTPGSNIVCFVFRPTAPGASLGDLNALNRRIYARFTLQPGTGVYAQSFFVSRTEFQHPRYSHASLAPFLAALGVTRDEFEREGVFVLRCVLMSPWYQQAKRRGRFVLSELAEALYDAAEREWNAHRPTESGGDPKRSRA